MYSRHILRVYGLTGAETRTEWTPPSCVLTTQPPTTTQSSDQAGLGQADTLDALLQENDQLRQGTPSPLPHPMQ